MGDVVIYDSEEAKKQNEYNMCKMFDEYAQWRLESGQGGECSLEQVIEKFNLDGNDFIEGQELWHWCAAWMSNNEKTHWQEFANDKDKVRKCMEFSPWPNQEHFIISEYLRHIRDVVIYDSEEAKKQNEEIMCKMFD